MDNDLERVKKSSASDSVRSIAKLQKAAKVTLEQGFSALALSIFGGVVELKTLIMGLSCALWHV